MIREYIPLTRAQCNAFSAGDVMIKKREMRSLLLGLSVLAAFAACSKHSAPASAKGSIIGRWRLVMAVGGIAGSTSYPPKDSVFTLALNSDSTWQTLINARTTGSGTFAFVSNPGGPANPLPMLVFTPPHLYYTYTLSNDTLTINDPCCDLYTRTYARSGGK